MFWKLCNLCVILNSITAKQIPQEKNRFFKQKNLSDLIEIYIKKNIRLILASICIWLKSPESKVPVPNDCTAIFVKLQAKSLD